MGQLPVPVARRLRRPSWRDARLLVGILLVLVAIVGTARLVASADDTRPVYAAARTLVPGEELSPDDLVAVPVRLSRDASLYLDATAPVAPGTFAVREVRAGELVPGSALGDGRLADGRTVTVPVDPAAAAGYAAGTVADVWVSHRAQGPGAGAGDYAEPVLLVAGAGVQGVPAEQGGLGPAASRTSVRLLVAPEDVPAVIAAVDQEARITLVPVPGQDLDP